MPRLRLSTILTGLTVSLAPIASHAELAELPGEIWEAVNLKMLLHEPAAIQDGLPLIVALHGCQMSAAKFDDAPGLTALADALPALLLLPQQSPNNNPGKCFNFFDLTQDGKGLKEAETIHAAIESVIASHKVARDKVYIMGLSAGGGMTSVMLANYPETFAGAAIIAGLPYGCNSAPKDDEQLEEWKDVDPKLTAFYGCGIGGSALGDKMPPIDRSPEDWLAFLPAPEKATPPISIWQGGEDVTVHPANLDELLEQWTVPTGAMGDPVSHDVIPQGSTGQNTIHDVYANADGEPVIETWFIEGFGHAVPVDPGTCGSVGDGTFTADANICAVEKIADFWVLTGQ